MSKSTVVGIRSLLDRKVEVTRDRLRAIRDHLLSLVQWPTFDLSKSLRIKTQTVLTIPVRRFRLPILDLYEGVVRDLSPERANPPIVVSFPSKNGPALAPANYIDGQSTIECLVPAHAASGMVELMIPTWEHYGSREGLTRLADSLGIDLSGIRPSEHGVDICPPFPGPRGPLADEIKWKWMLAAEAAGQRYMSRKIGVIQIGCSECTVGCPHGAIVLDENGICSVDPDRCFGQKYHVDRTQFELTPDGRQVYKRFEEEPCWNCFDGSEQYSQKCQRGILRKTLHHNGVCCASCGSLSRVTGPTLMQLCPYDAISETPVVTDGIFSVDKEACTGCMSCYLGINCANNVGANEPLCSAANIVGNPDGNYTVRMTAYAEHAGT